MIYLTGDIHGKIEGHFEQEIAGSEILAAKKFLEILKKYKISSTLFVNGKSFEEEKAGIDELLRFDVELGGHTYDNFGKLGMIRSYLNRKIWGCVYGSPAYQRRDIEKTRRAFEKAGIRMNSWRTHAFGSNNKTFEILRKNGVRYVSDLLGQTRPFSKGGIIHLPVNIPVDQNTLAFGPLRPENRNPFVGCKLSRIMPEEWFGILKKRVYENEKNKIDSVILIHPITMAVLDGFELFEKIAKFLSQYKSAKVGNFEIKENG